VSTQSAGLDPYDTGTEGEAGVVAVAADLATTRALLGPAQRAYQTRVEEMLLTAVTGAVTGWTNAPCTLIDLEHHGRDIPDDDIDVSRTVGWFTAITPTHLSLDGCSAGDLGAALVAVRDQLHAIPGGHAYGLARYLRDDDLSAALAAVPPAPISFNYLGNLDPILSAAHVRFSDDTDHASRHPDNRRTHQLEIISYVRDGQMRITLRYDSARQTADNMSTLAEAIVHNLDSLVRHCVAIGPADLPRGRRLSSAEPDSAPGGGRQRRGRSRARSPEASPWLVPWTHDPTAELRLVCIPHAGAGPEAYRDWPAHLPASVAVEAVHLPGRGSRLTDQPLTNINDIAAQVATQVTNRVRPPFVFFGHSMGAMIAYEATRLLCADGSTPPQLLVVSGLAAPHLPSRERRIHDLPADDLFAVLTSMGGIPEQVLADPDLRDIVLRIFRADFEAIDSYRWQDGPPLSCPIMALTGTEDPAVTDDEWRGWDRHSRRLVIRRAFSGGHFYLQTDVARVVGEIADALRRLAAVDNHERTPS
jgi:non-ribosomal peptide synthase protein (TIGR01720 family)